MKGFISYTHSDHALCLELQSHLALSKDHGGADFWADRRIQAGEQWSAAIEQAIDAAEVFLLLISVKFFDSDYIMNIELPRVLARAAQCDGLVVPVILRRCGWRFRIRGYQAVPKVGGHLRPICNWRSRNDGHDAAAEQVLAAIQARTARLATPGGSIL